MKDDKNLTIKSFFWNIIKEYKFCYLLILQAPVLSPVYSILYSYAMKLIIDLFLAHDVISLQLALDPIFLFIFAQVFLDISCRAQDVGIWKSQPFVSREVISRAYNYVQNHSISFFQKNELGTLTSKIKAISDRHYIIFKQITGSFGQSFFKTLAFGGVLFFINKYLFVMIICFGCAIGLYYFIRIQKISYLSEDCAEGYHAIMGKIGDNINNIFNLFSFATKDKEFRALQNHYNASQIPKDQAYYKYDFLVSFFASFIYWFFSISIFFFLIYLKNKKLISVGDIAFCISMTYLFSEHIWLFFEELKDFTSHIAQLRSSFSIIYQKQELARSDSYPNISIRRGDIIFRNVNFFHQDKSQEASEVHINNVFQGLNLHIKAGEKIGLVGHSGAGKSTLISLLLKYFEISSGEILIDGQNISNFNANSIRRQVSLIPQDIMLFHRTISENICYSVEESNTDAMVAAAKIAKIHQTIETLPQKYNTIIGEKGFRLSGGQRQRIAIARAILKNAPILIFDEATSALDSDTELEIQNSINELLMSKGFTVIAVAHRLSTLKHMDRIIVLDQGRIIQEGSFRELIADSGGHFKKLWTAQAGDF